MDMEVLAKSQIREWGEPKANSWFVVPNPWPSDEVTYLPVMLMVS